MKKTAWAVVDWDMWHKDKNIMGLVFSPHLEAFIEAIFPLKEAAESYSARLNKVQRTIVVPVEIHYSMPNTEGVRYKSFLKNSET